MRRLDTLSIQLDVKHPHTVSGCENLHKSILFYTNVTHNSKNYKLDDR